MGKAGVFYLDKQHLLGTESLGRAVKSGEFLIP